MKLKPIKVCLLSLGIILMGFSSAFALERLAAAESVATPESAPPVILKGIRPQIYSNLVRVVFDLSASTEYSTQISNGYLYLFIHHAQTALKNNSFMQIDDELVPYLNIQKIDDDLVIGFPDSYKLNHSETTMDEPARIVMDFDRDFTTIISSEEIASGVKLMRIIHGSQSGMAYAYAVNVDTSKAEVVPVPAPPNPTILERFVDIINPFSGEPYFSFSRNTVSNIVKHYNAIGGINGSFFSPYGYPFGIFMVNYELMTSPIYERTALAVTEDNLYYIDNFASNDYFYLPSGVKMQIKAINQPVEEEGVILFTRRWGGHTGSSKENLDIVVKDNRVVNLVFGNAEIPADGYVLTVSGSPLEYMCNNLKVGDQLCLSLNLIPYSISNIKNVRNLIGGGPRLVKDGAIYVSKYEEKFQRDVARNRAARSAVGITDDESILLVAVDGKKPKRVTKLRSSSIKSVGMTLEELSRLMIYLGANDAMNLDGGSSSAMVLKGKLINSPTPGTEISVANALVIRSLK